MKRREISLPMLRAQAPVAPETLDEGARTVEVRFYSGASVQRFPFFEDPYELSFSLDKGAARLERFNAGAPLMDNHRAYGGVGDVVLGVVEEAWLSEDGGHARVKLAADRPDILARIKDGILRNFSMGAVIHQLKDITEKGDPQRRLLAIDWEPHELSIVPVPADPGAQALAQAERFPCQLVSTGASAPTERKAMKTKVRLLANDEIVEIDEKDFDETLHSKDLEKAAAPHDAKAAKRAVDDAIERDQAFAKEVRRLAAHFNLDEVWAQRHIKLGTSIEQVLGDATETRAKLAPVIDDRISLGDEFESIPWRMDRMADALCARAQRKAPPEPAAQYARHSIAECGFEFLSLNGRTRGRTFDARRHPDEVIREALALHTTSDFTKLLENVMNKMLLPEYEAAAPSYRKVARPISLRDFRAHPQLRAGDFPNLLQVNEHGEFKHGTISESKESVTAVTYGRILGFSRQVLVNDDLMALQDFGGRIARRVADFENATFYASVITAAAGLGPTLANDSVAVYNSAHGNLLSAGALSNDRLGEALSKMMSQTGLDGIKLNIVPEILLVPPGSVVLAKTLLAQITPNQASQVNPFAGEMAAVGDANLSGTRFYVLVGPSNPACSYVYGSLDGQAGPFTQIRDGFEVDGIEIKVRRDFGVGAVDFRGGTTGAGV